MGLDKVGASGYLKEDIRTFWTYHIPHCCLKYRSRRPRSIQERSLM